jgi:hypothetical protein
VPSLNPFSQEYLSEYTNMVKKKLTSKDKEKKKEGVDLKVRSGLLPGDIVLCEKKPHPSYRKLVSGDFYVVSGTDGSAYSRAIYVEGVSDLIQETNFSLFERPRQPLTEVERKARVLFYNQHYYKKKVNPRWAEVPLTSKEDVADGSLARPA